MFVCDTLFMATYDALYPIVIFLTLQFILIIFSCPMQINSMNDIE